METLPYASHSGEPPSYPDIARAVPMNPGYFCNITNPDPTLAEMSYLLECPEIGSEANSELCSELSSELSYEDFESMMRDPCRPFPVEPRPDEEVCSIVPQSDFELPYASSGVNVCNEYAATPRTLSKPINKRVATLGPRLTPTEVVGEDGTKYLKFEEVRPPTHGKFYFNANFSDATMAAMEAIMADPLLQVNERRPAAKRTKKRSAAEKIMVPLKTGPFATPDTDSELPIKPDVLTAEDRARLEKAWKQEWELALATDSDSDHTEPSSSARRSLTLDLSKQVTIMRNFVRKMDLVPSHVAQRNWTCPLCPQHFKTRSLAERHITGHLGFCAYHCPLCDRSFVRYDSVMVHMRSACKASETAARAQKTKRARKTAKPKFA